VEEHGTIYLLEATGEQTVTLITVQYQAITGAKLKQE
jgi:hypothetical protein